MRKCVQILALLLCSLGCVFAQLESQSSAGKAAIVSQGVMRPWAPADSVRVRYFLGRNSGATMAYNGYGPRGPFSGEKITASPDGRYFFFVTFRGDLSCDCMVEELQVFGVAD